MTARHLPASNGSGVADGSLSGAYDGPPPAHGGWARVADRYGLLHYVWHPSLFVFAVYIIVLSSWILIIAR